VKRLPGGLWQETERRRDYRFKPVDGTLEMALSEAASEADSTASAVTAALSEALSEVAGGPASPDRLRQLCVADRQFLMRQLALRLDAPSAWLSARCRHCDQSFDFHVDFAELPTQSAGEAFPRVELEVDGTAWQFRLPNGADQEALAEQPDIKALLSRCLLQPAIKDAIDDLGDSELEAIDQAMDDASPAVVTEVQADCPHCGKDNRVALNPYSALNRTEDRLLAEIHQLAMHYHWSERDILMLPRARRNAYLRMIDRARGMTQ